MPLKVVIALTLAVGLTGCTATRSSVSHKHNGPVGRSPAIMIIDQKDIEPSYETTTKTASAPAIKRPVTRKTTSKSQRHSGKKSNYTPRRVISFIWPIKGNIALPYGSKSDKSTNKGIDIKAREGTSVSASRGGKVVYCDSKLKGFGQTIIIDHMDGFQTVYSYNSGIYVKVGDIVKQRDVIAKVGSSGRANEPMLHFEIRKNGEPLNPEFYLPRG